ncbi:hypothetical protein VIGAN_05113300, partial [Vigna angularis var. angularis]
LHYLYSRLLLLRICFPENSSEPILFLQLKIFSLTLSSLFLKLSLDSSSLGAEYPSLPWLFIGKKNLLFINFFLLF